MASKYFFRCMNENAVAGFETDEEGKVYRAAPIIYKKIMGLNVASAVKRLEESGWKVEGWSERPLSS